MTRQQDSWTILARMMGNTEKFWVQFQDENFKVDFFDADKTLSKSDFVELMADYRYVIAPALMPNIVNLLKTLRETLGLKFQVIAYAHELPSIFFASLKLRSVDSFFLQSDIFITHCEADLKLTKLSFKNPNVLSIPADFLNSQDSKLSLNKKYPIKNFFYLGRISEQKNLHTLICALSLIQDQLRNKKIIFHMYGFHDHYGTPNLASDAGAYYDFLGSLLEEFKIGDLFKFYGFKKISHLNQYMKSMQGVGIFPSIHSDENFGLAPFDLLKGGVPVLLTEWGGFKDFIKNFPKLTTKIPVEQGPLGPFVNPSSLAKIILNEIKNSESASMVLKKNSTQKRLPYCQSTHISLLKDALFKNISSTQKLIPSAYAVQAISQCQYSKLAIFAGRTWPQNGKIFSTYSDPLLILSSLKYGMKKLNQKQKRNPQLLPWVKKKGNGYIVHDPIKGTHKFLDIKELIKNGFIF